MSENRNDSTDLTVINGIGKSREKWLREVLRIQTLRDLSQMSVDSLEAQVKAEGIIVSRTQIENWIEQAKALATDQQQESPPVGSHDWMPYASFVVEYQVITSPTGHQQHRTTVHHMETDRGTSWPGAVTGEIADWVREQIAIDGPVDIAKVSDQQQAELTPVPAKDEFVEAVPENPTDDTVKIVQIRAFQPASAMLFAGHGKHGQPFLGSLKSGEPFALEAEFTLDNQPASGKLTCVTQFYAYETTSGAKVHLGDSAPQSFADAQTTRKALLPEANLSQGLYRLQVYTTIQSTPPRSSYVEVPFVQVN